MMGRLESWFLSAAIHGALILGALLLGIRVAGTESGGVGAGGDGFGCSFGTPEWKVAELERPAEVLHFLRERDESGLQPEELSWHTPGSQQEQPFEICNLRPDDRHFALRNRQSLSRVGPGGVDCHCLCHWRERSKPCIPCKSYCPSPGLFIPYDD